MLSEVLCCFPKFVCASLLWFVEKNPLLVHHSGNPIYYSKSSTALQNLYVLPGVPFPVLIFLFIWQPTSSMVAWGSPKFLLVQPTYRDLLLMGSGDLLWQPFFHWIFCFIFECMWILAVHICVAYLEISSRMQLVSCLVSDQILLECLCENQSDGSPGSELCMLRSMCVNYLCLWEPFVTT